MSFDGASEEIVSRDQMRCAPVSFREISEETVLPDRGLDASGSEAEQLRSEGGGIVADPGAQLGTLGVDDDTKGTDRIRSFLRGTDETYQARAMEEGRPGLSWLPTRLDGNAKDGVAEEAVLHGRERHTSESVT